MDDVLESAGRIVVGTDGSERSQKAVHWAAERAAARKLPLVVTHITGELRLTRSTAGNYIADYDRAIRENAEAHVDEMVAMVKSEFPDVDVSGVVLMGNPQYILATATEDAALVVIGTRGQSATTSVRLLGGTTDAVISHSRGPVAIITDEAHENPNGPVVLGVDDSKGSRAAARLAFEAAELRGVPVVAIHSWHMTEGVRDYSSVWTNAPLGVTEGLEDMVREVVAEASAAHPDVAVEVRVLPGVPDHNLVEASSDAGLLVVGSRGRGGFTGLLLGSTSKKVVREAHCPVIVTRG